MSKKTKCLLCTRAEQEIKKLNEALDLVLIGEQIGDGLTSARQEIEEVYGYDYFTNDKYHDPKYEQEQLNKEQQR